MKCTYLGVTANNGNKVWKWTWDGTKQNNSAATQPAKIIFNNTSSPQTDDLTFANGGYYNKNGLVKVLEPTGIETITQTEEKAASETIYDIYGRKVSTTNRGGLYIKNGKKFIAK